MDRLFSFQQQPAGRDNHHVMSIKPVCLRAPTRGFSLIELLVVVAVIAMLASFAIPAFNSIGQARGVSEAAYQVSAAVELARSEAISRQTYVWLGMQPQTNFGNLDLRLGIVYSKDGTANTGATNLQPIGKSLLIQRVGLTNATVMDVGTNNIGSPVDLSAFSGGVAFGIGQTTNSDRRTVTFTPLGEATTNPSPTSGSGFDPRLGIGLRQARGTALVPNNDIAVVIDGSVGLPTIYRK